MAARLRLSVDITRWHPVQSEFDFLLSLLPQEEATECTRFRFEDDKKRALISRLLQRYAAFQALGIPHADVVIKRTKGRKPFIANTVDRSHAPNYNYSVSHEGDYVVLASETLYICGCDVAAPQQLRRRPDQPFIEMLSSFRSQFTPLEWRSVHTLAPNEQAMEAKFRQIWSLKEAYVKATGEGLGFDLSQAEFIINGTSAKVNVKGVPQPLWTFHLHELGRNHWVSVARAPTEAIVDAWGEFTATLQQRELCVKEQAAALAAPEPPFTMVHVSDLIPQDKLPEYEVAGGDVI